MLTQKLGSTVYRTTLREAMICPMTMIFLERINIASATDSERFNFNFLDVVVY
jgi:hypothetical protein